MSITYLMHHGVQGMKWGVRRYQNKDGTLTSAGRKRYEKELSRLKTEKKVAMNRKRTANKLSKLDDLRDDIKKINDSDASGKTVDQQKQKVLQSRSASELYKNAHLFTTEELRTAYDRLGLEKNIKDLADSQISKGKSNADKLISTSKKISDFSSSAANIAKNASMIFGVYKKIKGESSNTSNIKVSNSVKKSVDEAIKGAADQMRKEEQKKAEKQAKQAAKADKKAAQQEAKAYKRVSDYDKKKEKVYDSYEIFDRDYKGESGRTRKVVDDYIYTTGRDLTYSSPTVNRYAEIGQRNVAGLFEPPKKKRR